MPAAALAPLSPWTDDEVVALSPQTTEVQATLPVGAATAYAAFADLPGLPRWMSVVQSVRVVQADEAGRPKVAAFLARMERATIGYSLHYAWDPTDLQVWWTTPPGTSLRIGGDARFRPLSARACLFHYRLTLEVPLQADWANASFTGNAAAAVASEFREHLRRFA